MPHALGGRGLCKKDVPQTELNGLPPTYGRSLWQEETTYTKGQNWGTGEEGRPHTQVGQGKLDPHTLTDRAGQGRRGHSFRVGTWHGGGGAGPHTWVGGAGARGAGKNHHLDHLLVFLSAAPHEEGSRDARHCGVLVMLEHCCRRFSR